MTGKELMEFIKTNSEWVSPQSNDIDAEKYFNETVDRGLYFAKYLRGKLVGVVTYYRVADFTQAVLFDNVPGMPVNPIAGPYLYISFICVVPEHRKSGIMDFFVKKLQDIKPAVKAAYWVDPEGQWKILNRSKDMKSNCGIVAFDQIAGMLNGRSNVISLRTLCRIAQDNEFIMFPLKVKRADLVDVAKPYILHNDFHFQTINSDEDLIAFNLPEEVHVLSQTLSGGTVVDEDEAKTIRGSKKVWKQILAPFLLGPVAPFFTGARDPWGKALGSIISAGTGFVTGGLPGAIIGEKLYGLQAGRDLNNKTPINFRSGLSAAGTGAASGASVGVLGSAASGLGSAIGAGTIGSGLSSAGAGLSSAAANAPLSSFLSGTLGSLGGGAAGGAAGSLSGAEAGSSFGSGLSPITPGLLNSGTGLLGAAGTPGATGGAAGLSSLGSNLAPSLSNIGTAGAGLLSQAPGAAAGTFASKLGSGGALGALSLGGSVLDALRSKKSYGDIPPEIGQALNVAQGYASGNSPSPSYNAAQHELSRGINAGVGGIFPQTQDGFFDAALRQFDIDNTRRKEAYVNDQAKYGKVNSGETIEQLRRFDEEVAQRRADFIAKYQQEQQQQSIGGMEKYLDLALQGNQQAMQYLIDALGDQASAKMAIDAYNEGLHSTNITQRFGDLGSSLLSNAFNPATKVTAGLR